MKKLFAGTGIVVVMVAALIGIIGTQIGQDAPKRVSSPSSEQIQAEVIKELAEAAAESNRRGPIMVDKDTRWDRSEAGPGVRITYFYSFPHSSSKDITPASLKKLEATMRNGVCSNKRLQPLLDYGATYAYAYSGNDGAEISRFEISKTNCT